MSSPFRRSHVVQSQIIGIKFFDPTIGRSHCLQKVLQHPFHDINPCFLRYKTCSVRLAACASVCVRDRVSNLHSSILLPSLNSSFFLNKQIKLFFGIWTYQFYKNRSPMYRIKFCILSYTCVSYTYHSFI